MIVIKFFECIGIVIICTYLGIDKSKKYSERVFELQRIKNGLNFFKSKIEFVQEPIKDILEDISKSIYDDKESIFKNARENMKNENINYAWNNAVNNENKINQEDKELLKMFGKLLGRTDKKGQVSEIELSLNFIENQIKKAELEKSKNAKLFKSLGIIIGLGIVIVIW